MEQIERLREWNINAREMAFQSLLGEAINSINKNIDEGKTIYVKNLIMVFIFLLILNFFHFNVLILSDFIFVNVILEVVFLIYLLTLCMPKSEIKKFYDIVRSKLNFDN